VAPRPGLWLIARTLGSFRYTLTAAATVPLLPLLAVQGRQVRKVTPLLPGARGPDRGEVGSGEPLRLLLIGESTVAGVGVKSHDEGLAGRTAASLAAEARRAVQWRAVGEIGATARATLERLVPRLGEDRFDVVAVALGVNDTTKLRSPGGWETDVGALVEALRARLGPVPVALSKVPPMHQFPSLPWPLRAVMGERSEELNRRLSRLAARLPDVLHVDEEVPAGEEWFCRDRFHPSAKGYAFWGEVLGARVAGLVRR